MEWDEGSVLERRLSRYDRRSGVEVILSYHSSSEYRPSALGIFHRIILIWISILNQ